MRFEEQEDNKRKRIIIAALQEFTEYGYDQASTNRIVKRAGVGKGMLYYYFNNKQDLYLYLVKYSLDVIEKEFISHINFDETDFFERFRKIAEFEMKVYFKNTYLFNFISHVFVDESSTLPSEINERIKKLQTDSYGQIYDNIDFSKFRDDIDVQKAFQLIRWAMDGYQNELLNQLKGTDFSKFDFETYFEEFLEYLEVLRKSFYK